MRTLVASILALALVSPSAMLSAAEVKVKSRLDHFENTPNVLVISTIPSEITKVTCGEWTMLGLKSWKDHNDFTIPAAVDPSGVPTVSVAVMDASKFDGYCPGEKDIIAHTDDGDYWGVLDRGAGKWNISTRLTFSQVRKFAD